MKTRPKKHQIVYWLSCDEDSSWMNFIVIEKDEYDNLGGSWSYNMFNSYKKALKAKRKIMKILREK